MILELPPIVFDAFRMLLALRLAPWIALHDANRVEFIDPYQHCTSSLKCGYGRSPWLGDDLGARWKRPGWDQGIIPAPRFASAWSARFGGRQLTALHAVDLASARERAS